jgi:dCMP deaminase
MGVDSKEPDDWDNIFFQEATLWSRRSHDIQTQCGCVLVKDKTAISSGYNGFIRDIDDSDLPNTRPEKYSFMIHAEANAIYNSVRIGRSTLGASAYITAVPCLDCLQMLYQCGIQKIFYSDISNPKMCTSSAKYLKICEKIDKKMDIIFISKTKLSGDLLLESYEKFCKNLKERVDK